MDAGGGAGIRATNAEDGADWQLSAEQGLFSSLSSWILRDRNMSPGVSSYIVAWVARVTTFPAEYYFQRINQDVRLFLGRNSANERWWEVNAETVRANTDLFTRGRTVGEGVPASYTPTFGDITGGAGTLGDGTLTGRVSKVGKTVTAFALLVWGTTTSVPNPASSIYITLPSTATGDAVGVFRLLEAGVQHHVGAAYLNTTTRVCFLNQGNTTSGISGTTPFVFAAGDQIAMQITYEEA
jgi:hypothetical protein